MVTTTSHTFTEELSTFPSEKWWKGSKKSVKAVCFDMDGTLLDSEPLHAEALWQMVRKGKEVINYKGKVLKNADDLHTVYVGMCDEDVYLDLIEAGLWSKDSTVQEFVHLKNGQLTTYMEQSLLEKVLKPEALAFLDFLKSQEIFCALVSASQSAVVKSFVKRLNLESYFSAVYGAEDTEKTKPAPDPYLAACKTLGFTPKECLAFEDSSTGYESASNAGMQVVRALWFS